MDVLQSADPAGQGAGRRGRDRRGALGAGDFEITGPFDATHRLRDPAQGGGALLDLGVYPVSFAHLLLGEPADIAARSVISAERVDLQTSMVLSRESGAQALLHCSIIGHTGITASVTGSQGRIDIPHGFFRLDRFVLHRHNHEPEVVTADPEKDTHSSLKHEAVEVMRCMRAGELESTPVPLAGSLSVMRTLDAVRDRVGVRYPGEPDPDLAAMTR